MKLSQRRGSALSKFKEEKAGHRIDVLSLRQYIAMLKEMLTPRSIADVVVVVAGRAISSALVVVVN
jgi:hypothetical protein